MEEEKTEAVVIWLQKELLNFGLVLPESRVKEIINHIIKLLEKE